MQIESPSPKTPIQQIQSINNPKNQIQSKSMSQIETRLRKSKRIAKKYQKNKQKKLRNKNINKQNNNSLSNLSNRNMMIKQHKSIKKNDQIKEQQRHQLGDMDHNWELKQFYSQQITQYYPQVRSSQKTQVKRTKKLSSSMNQQQSLKQLLKRLENEPQINIKNYLFNVKQIYFPGQKHVNLQAYQKSGQNFMKNGAGFKALKFQNQQHNKNSQKVLQKQTSFILYNYDNPCVQIKYKQPSASNARTRSHTVLPSYELEQLTFFQQQFISNHLKYRSQWKDIQRFIDQTCKQQSVPLTQQTKLSNKLLMGLAKTKRINKNKTISLLKKIQSQHHEKISLSLENQKYQHLHLQCGQKYGQQKISQNNNEFYLKCLIKKNIINAFDEKEQVFGTEKDIWNFFKSQHFREKVIQNQAYKNIEEYQAIQTQNQYKEYMKRMKNKKFIYKPTLSTNCTACFSNHYQIYNPIIKCSDCKIRYHKFCIKNDNKCDKCQYKKMSTLVKVNNSKCFICKNQTCTLMLYKIKGNRYVHNFCMFVYNLWNFCNENLVFDSEKFDELVKDQQSTKDLIQDSKDSNQIKKSNLTKRKSEKSTSIKIDQSKGNKSCPQSDKENIKGQLPRANSISSCQNNVSITQQKLLTNTNKQRQCKFCSLIAQSQYYLRSCSCCNSKFHILCGYLNGCKIQINEWKKNFQLDLKISCCTNDSQNSVQFQQLLQKCKFTRRFKLNYQRFAYNYKFQGSQQNQQKQQQLSQQIMLPQQQEQKKQQTILENIQTERCQYQHCEIPPLQQ